MVGGSVKGVNGEGISSGRFQGWRVGGCEGCAG